MLEKIELIKAFIQKYPDEFDFRVLLRLQELEDKDPAHAQRQSAGLRSGMLARKGLIRAAEIREEMKAAIIEYMRENMGASTVAELIPFLQTKGFEVFHDCRSSSAVISSILTRNRNTFEPDNSKSNRLAVWRLKTQE